MVIEIETGKYIHTAYAISDVADELLPDEWSTTERADGMDYIGTYTDNDPTDSSDPTDYEWEELFDLDVNDTDADDEMPVAEEQSQIASVEERLNILEQDSEVLSDAIDNLNTNVEGASTTSSDAMDIAQATGQHFWTDGNGVHISNEEGVADGDRNSLWNSIGMLFRKGVNYITAILTGGADGNGEKGIAIFDGNGNDDANVVAKFTDNGSTIGKSNNGQLILESDSLTMLDRTNANAFRVQNEQASTSGTVRDIFIDENNERGYQIGSYTYTLKNTYLGNLVATFFFSLPHPQAVSFDNVITLPVSSFGSWTVASSDVNASGSISFDASTNEITLTVDSFSASDNYQLTSFYVEYTSYPQLPTMAIGGNADLTDSANNIFLIGTKTGSGNIFKISRLGDMYAVRDASIGNNLTVLSDAPTQYQITLNQNGIKIGGEPMYKVITGITGTYNSSIASGSRADITATYTLPSNYNHVLGVRCIDTNHQTVLVLTAFDVSGDGSYGANVSLLARFRNVSGSAVASGTTVTWEILIGRY